MTHPPLNRQQANVLFTVAYEPRLERWNHKTLVYLRALKLVTSEPAATARGPSRSIYQWSITPLGKHYRRLPFGSPVPTGVPAEIPA